MLNRTPTGMLSEAERAEVLAAEEIATVRAELSRADAKAAAQIGLGGAALAILAAASTAAPAGPVRWLLAAAAIALAAAVVVAGLAIRPRLGRTGFMAWADLTAEDIARHMVTEASAPLLHTAGELGVYSRIARTAFRRVRLAADLLAVGLALVAAAVVVVVIA